MDLKVARIHEKLCFFVPTNGWDSQNLEVRDRGSDLKKVNVRASAETAAN